MVNSNLEDLKPVLYEIDPVDVTVPNLPMAVALQESHDLATLTAKPEVRNALLMVGVLPEDLDRLSKVVDATRQAQSDWVVARDRTKPESQKILEEQVYEHRNEMLAACRWNLRKDRVGMAIVSSISEGEGIEDAIQDLRDLSGLVESRTAAFNADKTFDVKDAVNRANTLANNTEKGLSQVRLTNEQSKTKDLRDRSYTHLADAVSNIREAGRYAYRTNPEMFSKFASDYLRRKRRKAASSASTKTKDPSKTEDSSEQKT